MVNRNPSVAANKNPSLRIKNAEDHNKKIKGKNDYYERIHEN